jgi:glyoxylate/hydroxypyruvate/2-ketogluconate reductase
LLDMTKPSVLIARAVFPEIVQRLSEHFEVEQNPDDTIWSREEFTQRLQGKVGVFTTGGERIDAALLAACPQLKICANMAVGYNNFDVPAMTAASVLATNAPDVLTETTADMGFALLMAAARRVSESEAYLRKGLWNKWAYDMFIGSDIHGAALGILGMGRIGQAIARRGVLGFGMKLVYHNRSRLAPEIEQQLGARYVSKQELFEQADHLVLVLPYSKEAHHIVGGAELSLMKASSTITNIGRGGLIDENALVDALAAQRIAAAGLDVFEGEPKVNPRLLALKNVVLTPHIGSATLPTRMAMASLAADNLIGYLLHGKAKTPLNPEVMKPA